MKKTGLLMILLLAAVFMGCSDGGGPGSRTGSNAGLGKLSVSLVDQTTYDYEAVYITIDEVQVHLGGNENSPNNWLSTNMPVNPITVNLLELVNGVREDLGLAELQAGQYTQMRLIIGDSPDASLNILSQKHPYANYVIVNSNPTEVHELKVPSGTQTGEKIVGGFEIFEDETTELVLDFDAQESVVRAGNSGQWLLKPTIKVAELKELSRIEGSVINNNQDGIEGVQISAQIFDGTATDDKEKVVVRASTFTNSGGYYTLFVEPGSYNLVAYGHGYNPQLDESITVNAGEVLSGKNFTLEKATTGEVFGYVTINGGDTKQYATLSFRLKVFSVQVEVDSIQQKNMTNYSIFLPEEIYTLIASTFGYNIEVYQDIEVVSGTPSEQDVTFNDPI